MEGMGGPTGVGTEGGLEVTIPRPGLLSYAK